MTTEERFERIEHITAWLVEQRKKDHEENRQLWRDTERQIKDLAVNTERAITRLAEETDRKIALLAEQSRATDAHVAQLSSRIDSLVSGIGEYVRRTSKPEA